MTYSFYRFFIPSDLRDFVEVPCFDFQDMSINPSPNSSMYHNILKRHPDPPISPGQFRGTREVNFITPPCSNPFDNHESPGCCWSFEALAESLQVPETRLAFQGLSEGRGMVQLLAVLTRPSEVVGDD